MSTTAASAAMPAPEESARAAGLRYINDSQPGIERRPWGRGFTYIGPDGKRITDPARRRRFEELVIPPAWTDVWICPSPRGHIQATGRDAKGRKQYRYHPRWREVRDATKFERMLAFGAALPDLRERVDRDLRKRSLAREKVLAAVVCLLERTLIRIGNDEYARDNGSFGLTTLHRDHAEVDGCRVRFEFRGKSGKEHEIDLSDRRLARVVAGCQELPGQEIFGYFDDDGEYHDVDSDDVNEYLREVTGEEFTAKDFRTWGASVAAAAALGEIEPPASETAARRALVAAIKTVAAKLGNTPATCRKFYIHPRVLTAFAEGWLHDVAPSSVEGLSEDEQILIGLLEHVVAAG